jgi:hypothetical protein
MVGSLEGDRDLQSSGDPGRPPKKMDSIDNARAMGRVNGLH